MVETIKGKDAALAALKLRRATKYEIPNNGALYAGSPMYFACIGCGAPIVVSEGYIWKPDLCEECSAMRKLGWLTE